MIFARISCRFDIAMGVICNAHGDAYKLMKPKRVQQRPSKVRRSNVRWWAAISCQAYGRASACIYNRYACGRVKLASSHRHRARQRIASNVYVDGSASSSYACHKILSGNRNHVVEIINKYGAVARALDNSGMKSNGISLIIIKAIVRQRI